MAGKLKLYSTTPGNNTSAPPDGWPEGMAPSAVNNAARQMMAQMAEWYRDAEWVDYADTVVGAAGQVYTISGDVTARYTVGRAIRQNSSDASRGIVTASSYSAPNTSVTVNGYVPSAAPTAVELGIGDKAISRLSAGTSSLDFAAFGGSLRATIAGTQVATLQSTGASFPEGVDFGANIVTGIDLSKHLALWSTTYGINITSGQMNLIAGSAGAVTTTINNTLTMSCTQGSVTLTVPINTAQGADIASAATVNLDSATGNVVNVTGTTTITAITLSNGRSRAVRFTGALQITAGASLVILPGNATAVTQAGDMATVEAIGGVKYVRLFRIGAQEFKAATGSIVAADTTITLPAGTYSAVRVMIRNLKSATNFALGLRFNGSTTTYTYAAHVWNPGTNASNGDNSANAILLHGNGGLINNTAPVCSEILIPTSDLADHQTVFARTLYQSPAPENTGVNIQGRWQTAAAVTSLSLHLRTSISSGLGATGVTPTAGSYELWLTP